MAAPVAKNRPQNSQDWVTKKLDASMKKFGSPLWDRKSLILFGCEGYFQLMGNPNTNDRQMYDDAMFVLTDRVFGAFNVNLDPNGYRPGHGHGSAKGMGMPHYGVHKDAYAIGKHKKLYPALRQVGKLIVRRDADDKVPKADIIVIEGRKYYLEEGDYQAMNMHPGGVNTTSSLGCQTFPRDQWSSFINLVVSESKRLKQKRFTYVKDRIRG